MKIIILKYIKTLPGYGRLCYKGNDGRYYVFQTGQWLLASKDWEPSHPVSNITFKI